MGTIQDSVQLPATQDAVWAVVSDPSRFDEWLTMHRSWQGDVPPQLHEGTQVTGVVSVLNMPVTITWTITAYDPPRHVTLAGTALAGVQVSIALDVAAAGPDDCAMTVVVSFDGQLVTGPIGQAVENAGRAELQASTEKLRGTLSAPGR
jgi:carbon monoxide dehydrogenase subunit G